MTDKPMSHEDLDTAVNAVPNDALNLLPNNTESREAKRLQKVVADLAHDALEKRDDRH
jgi:hypothetical protein